MLIEVTTVDGAEMVIGSNHIILCGPVSDGNAPVIGVCKVLLLGGAALVIREGLVSFKERVNEANRSGVSARIAL